MTDPENQEYRPVLNANQLTVIRDFLDEKADGTLVKFTDANGRAFATITAEQLRALLPTEDPSRPTEWAEAIRHLNELRAMYASIGAGGIPGLTLTLNPLLVRVERGERTVALYDAIMACE